MQPKMSNYFEGEMSDELYNALELHRKNTGEDFGEVFRKAMSLYLRVKREENNEVIIRNKGEGVILMGI